MWHLFLDLNFLINKMKEFMGLPHSIVLWVYEILTEQPAVAAAATMLSMWTPAGSLGNQDEQAEPLRDVESVMWFSKGIGKRG